MLFPLILLAILSRIFTIQHFEIYVTSFFIAQFVSLLVEHDHSTSGIKALGTTLPRINILQFIIKQKAIWLIIAISIITALTTIGLINHLVGIAAILIAAPQALSPQFYFTFQQKNQFNLAIDIISRSIILFICAGYLIQKIELSLNTFLIYHFVITTGVIIAHWIFIYKRVSIKTYGIADQTATKNISLKHITNVLFRTRIVTFIIAFLPFLVLGSTLEWVTAHDKNVSRLYLSTLAIIFPLTRYLLPLYIKDIQDADIHRSALSLLVKILPFATMGIIVTLLTSEVIIQALFNSDIELDTYQRMMFVSVLPILASVLVGYNLKIVKNRERDIFNVLLTASPVMFIGVTAAMILQETSLLYISVFLFEIVVAYQYIKDFMNDMRTQKVP
jgi:hypothetical protein